MEFIRFDSQSAAEATFCWASLPYEIRDAILGWVCLPAFESVRNPGNSSKVAAFASVSSEWQQFFEKRTFRRLVLDIDSLRDFRALVSRDDSRLGYIRKIWLRVRLVRYRCPNCERWEERATSLRNNDALRHSIRILFMTLQRWDPVRHGPEGLDLMLSAASPSDTQHRYVRPELMDDFPFHYAEDLERMRHMIPLYRINLAHGFLVLHPHCYCPTPLSFLTAQRLQGTSLSLHRPLHNCFCRQCCSLIFDNDRAFFSAVPVVKGLIIRRQCRRSISAGAIGTLLSRCLVALERFHVERNICLTSEDQAIFDEGKKHELFANVQDLVKLTSQSQDFASLVLPYLPKSLRQFSFTQWRVPEFELRHLLVQPNLDISSRARAYLPREMAALGQRLEQFCPPLQTDAGACLQALIEAERSALLLDQPVVSPLKRWILHCALPSPRSGGQKRFESLVVLAASAAMYLPKLEVFELWGMSSDEDESYAYIFRYVVEAGRAYIEWRSCRQHMETRPQVDAAWREVAQKHRQTSLVYIDVPFEETPAEFSESQGVRLYQHLLLRDLMLDPVTRMILEREQTAWDPDKGVNKLRPATFFHLVMVYLNDMAGRVWARGERLDDGIAYIAARTLGIESARHEVREEPARGTQGTTEVWV